MDEAGAAALGKGIIDSHSHDCARSPGRAAHYRSPRLSSTQRESNTNRAVFLQIPVTQPVTHLCAGFSLCGKRPQAKAMGSGVKRKEPGAVSTVGPARAS